ncbi:MAG: glycerol-3-phosphate 1-O-acyltransferase PlsY [Victivallales bacterium]|nr:glycerol-3-phosphate 1-O-acyltransferase PlsY [Victivallales bacterium]
MSPRTYCVIFMLLCGYIAGSIPFGFLIGMLNGIDIRKYGSHNIGATNVTRVLGIAYGRVCFFLDFLKGVLPVLLIGYGYGRHSLIGSAWGGVLVAIGCVLGHMFPCWLNFKGGKGVATSIGALIVLAFWPVIIALLVWWYVYQTTKIVSLASLATAIATPVAALVLRLLGWSHTHWLTIVLMFIIGAIIFWRHRENIDRLLHGKENSFKR